MQRVSYHQELSQKLAAKHMMYHTKQCVVCACGYLNYSLLQSYTSRHFSNVCRTALIEISSIKRNCSVAVFTLLL